MVPSRDATTTSPWTASTHLPRLLQLLYHTIRTHSQLGQPRAWSHVRHRTVSHVPAVLHRGCPLDPSVRLHVTRHRLCPSIDSQPRRRQETRQRGYKAQPAQQASTSATPPPNTVNPNTRQGPTNGPTYRYHYRNFLCWSSGAESNTTVYACTSSCMLFKYRSQKPSQR